MAAARNEHRLIVFPVPSLFLLTSAKVSVSLLQEFGFELLIETLIEIHEGHLAIIGEAGETSRRAKEILLDIPYNLRESIIRALHGSNESVYHWDYYYKYVIGLPEVEGSFQFRPNGTVDAVKSAQNLVHNEELDIKKRFKVACVFALVESVESLWAEMVASGEVESFDTREEEDMVSFWVTWLKESPRETSAETFIQSLGTLIPTNAHIFYTYNAMFPRFSAIFPLLRKEDRVNCFDLLDQCCADDLRYCLDTITKEEEELFLQKVVSGVLRLHLMWPYQNLFLDVATKLWGYMDADCFYGLLTNIRVLRKFKFDYNYSLLFDTFWNISPLHFREEAKGVYILKRREDWLERREREWLENEQNN